MGPSLAEILPRNLRPDCVQVPSKSARKTNSKTNQQASRFVRTPTQKFPARSTAFKYPVNQPGRPILRPAIMQAISLVVGQVWPEIDRLQDEHRRWVLGPSLAENRPNTDPHISGQTAISYLLNQSGRPVLRPASRQTISWVVGPSLAGDRPKAAP